MDGGLVMDPGGRVGRWSRAAAVWLGVLAVVLVVPAGAAPAPAPAGAGVDPFGGFGVVEGQAAAAAVFGEPPEGARLAGVGESWVRWELGDGRFQSEFSPGVVRVDTGGGWGLVDESLISRDGGWSPLRIGADVRFSGGGDRTVVAMTTEGVGSRLVWDGPQPLPVPVVDGPVATYEGLLPGVDLLLRAGPASVQYAWRFGPAAAGLLASPGEVRLRVEADGASPAQALPEDPVLLTPAGRSATGPGAAGQILMAGGWHDSAAGPRGDDWPLVREIAGGHGDLPVPGDAGGPGALQLSGGELSWSWPAMPLGPDAVFPLYARSSQSDIGKAYWLMVWSNGLTFYDDPVENARVGYDGWSGENKVSRSFFRFPVSGLFGMHVLSAQFWHAQVHSPNNTCNQAAWGSAVNYADATYVGSGGPGWPGPGIGLVRGSDPYGHGNRNNCPGDTRRAFDATGQVQAGIDGGVPDLNSVLFSSNEGDREGWRQYDNRSSAEGCTDQGGQWAGNCLAPRLVVTHTPVPGAPSGLSVADAYVDPEGVLPGLWMGVRHNTAAGFTVSAVVDTNPPGQAATLQAFFYFQTPDGLSNIASTNSTGWPAGTRASGLLCANATCTAHLGEYRLLVHTIVDGGAPNIIGEAFVPVRADLQPPAEPVVAVAPAGSGMWRITLTNPDPTDSNLRNLAVGLSGEGLWDEQLSAEEMRAYRDTGSVTVERSEAAPVVTWHAQSWDVARNPSTVGSATGRGQSAGPSLVWPLDGDGSNLVPGGPPLELAQTDWAAGRWGTADPTDQALAAGGTGSTGASSAPLLAKPAAGFVFSAWLRPAAGTLWTYGPQGAPIVRLVYAAGSYTAVLASNGQATVSLGASAHRLAEGWDHVSVWYHPGLERLGITIDGTRTATVPAAEPVPDGGPDDVLALTGNATAIDQFSVTARGPDSYYLAALAAAPRPDFGQGAQP